MQNSFLILNNIITLKCFVVFFSLGLEMNVVCPSGKLLNTKKKELFLVLEAGQCFSQHTLVPGNHLHSSLTLFQRGCKLLPALYVAPTLSQVKTNFKTMMILIFGIHMNRKSAALAYQTSLFCFTPL